MATSVKEPKPLSFFSFLDSINAGPKGIDHLKECTAEPTEGANPDSPEKQYNAFMVNRGLSYFGDTILFANELNRLSGIPAKMQFDFLRSAIKPRKRFSKWFKKMPDSDSVKLIMEKYGYSSEKARDVLPLIPAEELERIKQSLDKGGR